MNLESFKVIKGDTDGYRIVAKYKVVDGATPSRTAMHHFNDICTWVEDQFGERVRINDCASLVYGQYLQVDITFENEQDAALFKMMFWL